MLSTENPPPVALPDPSSSQISQLPNIDSSNNSSSCCDDEKASDNGKHLQLGDEVVVDLLESGLDDDDNNSSNIPLPKFSIRDYVFSTRGKDIETNWPFSLKNLQLCLKHGVKDVLPPFQSLDSVRNRIPSAVKQSVVENTCNSDVKKLSGLSSDHISSESSKSKNDVQDLAVDIDNINTNSSEEDKEFPSTTTTQSCSDTNPVPPIRSPLLEPEAKNSTGPSSRNPEFSVPAAKQVSTNSQIPGKKCRLIVKLSNISGPKSNEDSPLNSSVASDSMASKVCPVCKTFSSSSNTTLNAHIDQCLSGGSTIKWNTSCSDKVIKHRIKPRKTRLMVDIYKTAIPCTLEDLDRRNGTNWASNVGFPAHQDTEVCAEEKNKTDSSCGMEENEEGAVYIDSNGTKVRILSKFSDLPSSSNAKDDCGPRKAVKGDNKFLSSKKKKKIFQRQEYVKGGPCGEQRCSPRPNPGSEVVDGRGKRVFIDGETNEDGTWSPKANDERKFDEMGMIKQWVGSRRTGLKKKIHLVPDNHEVPDKTVESGSDIFIRGISDSNSPVSDENENSLLSTESRKRKKEFSRDSDDECMEQTGLRKRPGFSVSASQEECNGKKNGMFSNYNVKQSRKDGPSVHERFLNPPNDTENHVRPHTKKMDVNVRPNLKNFDGCFIGSKVSGPHAFSSGGKVASSKKKSFDRSLPSGGKKFTSLKKNLLSVTHESVRESKKKLGRKHLDFQKPRLQEASEPHKNLLLLRPGINRQGKLVETPGRSAAEMERDSNNLSMNRTRVLRIRKHRGEFLNSGKGGDKSSKRSAYLESSSHGVGKNMNSFMSGNVPPGTPDAVKEPNDQKTYSCDPMSDGEAFIAFSKSLDSTFPGFPGSSDAEHIPEHYTQTFEGGGEQEMYCSDDIGKDFVIPDNDMDGDGGRGDYFIDVDPIPIPGPPGSFLPSPGRLGSEELQGNSSLTSCKLHSSEDDEHDEPVDMDSSDSPISAASMASNSVPARSDSVSFVNLSKQSCDVRRGTQCGLFEVRIEQASSGEEKIDADESRDNAALQHARSGPIFESDRSCCCSRKEGALLSGCSSYQDSHLLGRRTMTMPSLPLPVKEQQMGGGKNERHIFNLGSETLNDGHTSGLEKNVANSSTGYAPKPISQNSEANKFLACDLESPSTSNPILRLMGKNLMVVSKDESSSPLETRPIQSSMVNEHPGLQLRADSIVSTNRIQTEPLSTHCNFSRGPVISENQICMQAQPFDFTSSDGSKVHENYGMPQCSRYPSMVVLPRGSFTSSLECHGYAGRCSLNPGEVLSRIRLDPPPTTYDTAKAGIPVPHLGPSDCSGKKLKEIVIIDDPPDSKSGLAIRPSCGDVMDTGGVSASMAFGYNHEPMQVNSNFCSYQITQGYPVPNGSRMGVQNANIQIPPSKGMNGNPVKWNCSPQGASYVVHHPDSLAASLPAAGHLIRSPQYFTPGFSQPASFTR